MMMILGMFRLVSRLRFTSSYNAVPIGIQVIHVLVKCQPISLWVGEDTITLEGSIVPEFGSQMSITALRAMGDTGKNFPLIAGTGKVLGFITLMICKKHKLTFYRWYSSKIEFSLKLTQGQKPGTLIGNAAGKLIGLL